MKGTVHTVTIAVLVPARAGTAHDGLAQEGRGKKKLEEDLCSKLPYAHPLSLHLPSRTT